ncbi:MAG: nucleotidyltransferase family protein [Acidobacteriota bacterium]
MTASLCQATIDQTLIAALRVFLESEGGHEPRAQREAIADPDALLARADAEGVTGILAELADRSDIADPSPAEQRLAAALGARRHRVFAHGARTLELLEELGRALSNCGLQGIALKGAALLAGLYRDHLGRRPVSDLDLLVRRQELFQVRAVLCGLGLRPHATRWRGDGVEIDLHTHLARSELLGHRHSPYCFPNNEVWGSALPCPVGGPAIRMLPLELQLLHLATHAVKHAFCRWIWLVDIALLLHRTEPERLVATAVSVRGERALAYSLSLLDRCFGLPPDPAVCRQLPRPGRLERQWLHQIAARRQPIGLGRLVAGLSIPDRGERLHYWREVALPPVRALRLASTGRTGDRRLRGQWLWQTLRPRTHQALQLCTKLPLFRKHSSR